jgi:hypothetical protein
MTLSLWRVAVWVMGLLGVSRGRESVGWVFVGGRGGSLHVFARELDPMTAEVVAFVDKYRDEFGGVGADLPGTAGRPRRRAAQAGLHLSVRELLDQLAGIGETVLLYHDGGKGRPRASRILTDMTDTQRSLYHLVRSGPLGSHPPTSTAIRVR